MKIYLVCIGINSQQNSGFNYGLAYIGSILKASGYDVSYFSLLNHDDCEIFFRFVEINQPLLTGFSVTTSQFSYLKNIITRIKKISNSFVVCGGPHPTLEPECITDVPGIDAFIVGEGEYPMLELANALSDKIDYRNIKNLCYLDENRVVVNPIRPLIEDLDILPFPDQECLRPKYYQPGQQMQIRFIFSRGCPFECSFCSNKAISEIYPNKSKYYRTRSPQNAINEIEQAEKLYNIRFIIFDDDCFTLNKKWFYEFIELYKNKFKYPFRCNIRVGTVNEDMVRLLKEANASNIGIGLEHGNEIFRMKTMKKTITNKQIEETFSLINKYNISHSDFIMVGMPFETKRLYLDTVRLCRKVDAKGHISIFNPYPGTELGGICRKNNWIPDKELFREREEATIDFPHFSKEDIQLAADAFPFFIENKRIPLMTPLALVPSAYYLSLSLCNIYRYYIYKAQQLLSFQFLKKKSLQS